ncbi:bZIP transcription factor tga10 [Ancistrocladus abbreviatus]
MGFARVAEIQVAEQEIIKLGGVGGPLFMAANKATSHKTHLLEIQQIPEEEHHPHLHPPPHHHNHQISLGMMQSSSLQDNFIGKENEAYDLGELDPALFMYLDGQADASSAQDHQRQNSGMKRPTLNIFPSQPMHVEPSTKGGEGVTQSSSGSKRPSEPTSMELSTTNPQNQAGTSAAAAAAAAPPAEPSKVVKREGNRKGPTSSSEQGSKTPDPKALRRLAQNREAARKSRLRKKAYVQQLESSRSKLTQLEQALQRARAQGMLFGGGDQGLPLGITNISTDAAVFDLEYGRWVEEHHRLTCELRAAVEEHLPENELKIYVDNWLAHYDVVINLKSMVAKSDFFHLFSGMWKTPAERCFMWMGGSRPSDVIRIVLHQAEQLTEHQLLGIRQLQKLTQEAEEALTQGLEALNQSLSDTIASDSLSCPANMANYVGQMALAINKLSTLESFVRQADGLRHHTFHLLHQLLTTSQAARCFLAIAEYFHRLRTLSSLWLARPRQE